MSLLSALASGTAPDIVSSAKNSLRPSSFSLGESIANVLAAAQPMPKVAERRRDKRHPFPYPVYLTPVGRDGQPAEKTLVVLGKHLSERGFDFYYRDPLPYRRAIVSFECPRGKWVGILLDLTWCRFGRHGWYDNGGRFIGVVTSPLSDEMLPSLME